MVECEAQASKVSYSAAIAVESQSVTGVPAKALFGFPATANGTRKKIVLVPIQNEVFKPLRQCDVSPGICLCVDRTVYT